MGYMPPDDRDREPEPRNGCLPALMVIGGVALIFPGACVMLVFKRQITGADLVGPGALVLLGMAMIGLALISRASSRLRR